MPRRIGDELPSGPARTVPLHLGDRTASRIRERPHPPRAQGAVSGSMGRILCDGRAENAQASRSMERFVAVLIEHCAGDFPLWLTSDQFVILPVSEKYNDYAQKVSELLNNSDIRGLVDERNEKVGKKIRDAELSKYPFMLIVGEKEAESDTISVRQRGKGDLGALSPEAFAALVQGEMEREFLQMENLCMHPKFIQIL